VQGDETFGWPDPVEFVSICLAPQPCLQRLFLELHRRFRIDEVARRNPGAMPRHKLKRRELIFRHSLLYVELVEKARGVDEVEGAWVERHPEDVSREHADRAGKFGLFQSILRLLDAFRIHIDGGDATILPHPLAEAFDPERRGTSCVEHVETADVPEEVEFAVAEGDEVVFELRSVFRLQVVPFV
jgi:hypothetical protein